MKKLLIISAMVGFALMAMGQKQQTDAKTFEVQFTPFGNSPISITGIKFRKFTDDYSAIRLEANISMNSSKSVSMQEGANGSDDDPNPLTYSKEGAFGLTLKPGIEKHFDGTSRLSPYVGGEAVIGFMTESKTEEYWSAAELINDEAFDSHTEWEQKTKDGSITLGLNALAGMDFYFADNIYLGAEFGFGLQLTSMSSTKYTSTDDNAWAVSSMVGFDDTNWGNGTVLNEAIELDGDGEIKSVTTRDDDKNGSEFQLGPNFNGALRLGFIF